MHLSGNKLSVDIICQIFKSFSELFGANAEEALHKAGTQYTATGPSSLRPHPAQACVVGAVLQILLTVKQLNLVS